MATQEEPGTDEIVKVENHHITRLLQDHALLITQNVNIMSLKRYLIQYHCIGLMEEERLTRGSPHDSNLELMKIIGARGVGAFEGFLAALDHSVQDDPGESGHEELGNILRKAYVDQKWKLSRDTSKAPFIATVSPYSSLQMTSTDSCTQIITASPPEGESALGRDIARQPSPHHRGSDVYESTPPLPLQPPTELTQEERDSEAVKILPNNTSEEEKQQAIKHKSKFTMSRSVQWLGSLGVIALSPLLLIVGITLMSISIEGFAGKRECDGIGIRHTLNVFNFFFGLLCLSVPGLLIMFMLYFHFENSKGECRKKIERLLVWLTIIFFLICFILTIGELLYSLLYVVQEVYTYFPLWRDSENGTLCDGAIYISSLSIITVSYTGVFLVLVGMGFYLAKLYFKWVTDKTDPGAIRNILAKRKND